MYTLEDIRTKFTTLEEALKLIPSATLVKLPQDMGIIPVDGFLLRELEIHYQGGTKVTHPEYQQFSTSVHPDFERLIVGIEKLAEHLSHHGLVAYIETTFTGGYGGHATMLWENGKRCGNAGSSINDVLKLFNVAAHPGLDEFETLGLGRHRSTREWLSKN